MVPRDSLRQRCELKLRETAGLFFFYSPLCLHYFVRRKSDNDVRPHALPRPRPRRSSLRPTRGHHHLQQSLRHDGGRWGRDETSLVRVHQLIQVLKVVSSPGAGSGQVSKLAGEAAGSRRSIIGRARCCSSPHAFDCAARATAGNLISAAGSISVFMQYLRAGERVPTEVWGTKKGERRSSEEE